MSFLKFSVLTTVFCLSVIGLSAQSVLDRYVSSALDNNIVLKQKNIALDKSLLAVKEAKSMFLPNTWLEGQYLLSKGGRSIDIPVGDLVNPIYKTLNQLTAANKFSYIDNVSEQFLPNNFYDARIKTTLPLYNPDLKLNRSIKQQQVQLAENEIDQYKRELVMQVKVAYYNFLAATQSIKIYSNALEVVQQNLRANRLLLANGKGLPAYVSRAESEVQNVESEMQDARNRQQNAAAYFNFLLNRPLTDTVEVSEAETILPQAGLIPLAYDISGREELKGLAIAKEINGTVSQMNRNFAKPRINLFLDLASQGKNFRFNAQTVFYFGGVQVQVPLYSGRRNLYKIEQSNLEGQNLQLSTQQVKQQLELAAFTSRNNIADSYANYKAANKQQEAAQWYFKLIDRGYKEGVNSFIEFLDARNQLTNSSLKVVIQQYKFLSALADYERQTASYSIN